MQLQDDSLLSRAFAYSAYAQNISFIMVWTSYIDKKKSLAQIIIAILFSQEKISLSTSATHEFLLPHYVAM